MKQWVNGMNKNTIGTNIENWDKTISKTNIESFNKLINEIIKEKKKIHQGGGSIAIQKQHDKNRLTARERIDYILDDKMKFLEIGTYAGYNMYEEYGSPASGGVVTGIGKVENIDCMIIANDATVKAGAYFEITVKKTLRAQKIALENNTPIIYLVDSAGAFLPLQDQVFPDEAHFGRI